MEEIGSPLQDADKQFPKSPSPRIGGALYRNAKAGKVSSQVRLGELYYHGLLSADNQTPDYERALHWFRCAAQTNKEAMLRVATMYEKGLGCDQDLEKAVEWYKRAAENGNDDPGNVVAMTVLGLMYSTGYCVQGSELIAREYFLDAALRGFAAAQFHLGNLLHNARHIKRSPSKAVYWFTKAASQGHAPSAEKLSDIARIRSKDKLQMYNNLKQSHQKQQQQQQPPPRIRSASTTPFRSRFSEQRNRSISVGDGALRGVVSNNHHSTTSIPRARFEKPTAIWTAPSTPMSSARPSQRSMSRCSDDTSTSEPKGVVRWHDDDDDDAVVDFGSSPMMIASPTDRSRSMAGIASPSDMLLSSHFESKRLRLIYNNVHQTTTEEEEEEFT